jgi:hypothetical protein
LRTRRGDAPGEAGLPHPHRKGEAAEQNGDRRPDNLDAEKGEFRSEDDDSLRPLARALLALAEQLRLEEGS